MSALLKALSNGDSVDVALEKGQKALKNISKKPIRVFKITRDRGIVVIQLYPNSK